MTQGTSPWRAVEMAWPIRKDPFAVIHEEQGQAATEYALLAMWTVIVVIASFEALELALFDFYEDIATLICLPIP